MTPHTITSSAEQERAARPLRQALADELHATGAIASPMWRSAFADVPRHLFVPAYYQNTREGSQLIDASAGEVWLHTVYSDTHLLTRDDVTSSSTAPSLMAVMLEALDLTGTEAVLEIGTGTGYNAALLAAVVGDDNVTSIDIDPDLISTATRRLAANGQHPALVTGDGAAGAPDHAPFDRVIATCRLNQIPAAWLAQTTVDGVIVTPLGAGIARLTNHGRGHATGGFLPEAAYFMPLRHRPGRPELGDLIHNAHTAAGAIRTYEYDTSIYRSNEARFWLDLTLPDVGTMQADDYTIAYHPDGSWARLQDGTVTQAGPRNLWDAIESSHRDWLDADQPSRDRYTLSAASGSLHVWLGDKTTPVHTISPSQGEPPR